MITTLIIIALLGAALILICGVAGVGLAAVAGLAALLIDPIIAILVIYGIYKLAKKLFSKK